MSETVSIKDVYNELREIKQKMVSKQEIASLMQTMETLHNPKTMRQVNGSEQDIRAGRTKRVHGVKDLLAELEK